MNALGMALGHVVYGAVTLLDKALGWLDAREFDRWNVPGKDDL